jgi:Calcineurin-like phosphoesterase
MMVVSDTHLSARAPEAGRNWAAVARHVSETGAELVIHLGDLSLDGANDPADLSHARRLLDALPVPWVAVPGNHDIGDNPGSSKQPMVTPERVEAWRHNVGSDYWSHRLGRWTLLGLNAQLFGSGLPAEAEQWGWLDEQLSGQAGDHPMVFISHEPVAAGDEELNWRQSRVEQENLNFRRYGEVLREGLAEPDAAGPDADLLAEEVKLGCTLGMLLCLDRDHRLAYVLSDVFDISSSDAAFICSITSAAFRKRASRARAQLREFVGVHCGLVNTSAECRCDRRVKAAIGGGRVQPGELLFAAHVGPEAAVGEMERLHDLASLMRSHPDYEAPERVTAAIRRVINSGQYKVLE